MNNLKMQNFKNILEGIRKTDEAFDFIKENISEEFSVKRFENLISLPAIKCSYEEKFKLVLAVLKDGLENDVIISELCKMLITIQPYLWKKYKKQVLNEMIKTNIFNYDRKNQLKIFETMEIMYAKGYGGCLKIIRFILENIHSDNMGILKFDEETIKIELSKLAYLVNKLNCSENFEKIDKIGDDIRASKHKSYLGMLYYYKAVFAKNAPYECYKNKSFSCMTMAKEKKFWLALECNY